MKLILGFTESDRDNDYVSFHDGYRSGAKQTIVELVVSDDIEMSVEEWCEAAFVATNMPGAVVGYKGATTILHLIQGIPHRSLSKGDTVTVDGVMYECRAADWRIVKPTT